MSVIDHAPLVLPAPLSPWRRPAAPPASDLARAAAIIRHAASSPAAHLVLLGDKKLLFSRSGRAFIMYGATRRTWVAMGDPVGPMEDHAELIGRFIAQCAHHRVRPAFYRADAQHLPLYRARGLSAIKLGEEAVVRLADGADRLSGGGRANLRQASARAAREGCRFQWVEPGAIPDLLPRLLAVSGAWLHTRHTREKRFSGGRFDAAYLAQFPIAVVWREQHPVAFANLWPTADHATLAADLMRRCPDAPYGTMDFLFAEVMRWGAARGYRELNLGMAPLSGFAPGDLPPFWHGIAGLVARHGARLYHFEGLRQFKAKFTPEWRPRYLVCRPGLSAALAVADVTLLIAGGWGGVLGR